MLVNPSTTVDEDNSIVVDNSIEDNSKLLMLIIKVDSNCSACKHIITAPFTSIRLLGIIYIFSNGFTNSSFSVRQWGGSDLRHSFLLFNTSTHKELNVCSVIELLANSYLHNCYSVMCLWPQTSWLETILSPTFRDCLTLRGCCRLLWFLRVFNRRTRCWTSCNSSGLRQLRCVSSCPRSRSRAVRLEPVALNTHTHTGRHCSVKQPGRTAFKQIWGEVDVGTSNWMAMLF